MASTKTKLEVLALAIVIALGIGYFIYSNATTGTVEVDVTLGEGSSWFTPTNATATVGQTVTFVVFNDDDSPHVFNITAFNATTGVIASGYSGRMTFVADKAGSFPFWCPLSADDAQGENDLNGTLTVNAG